MIIARLVGGLGNQMFQYATGFALARSEKTSLGLDTSWYETSNSSVWVMAYALDCFDISATVIDPAKYKVVQQINFADRLAKNHVVEYKEHSLTYDERIWRLGKRVVLDGYWQSEKYFAHFRDDLIKEFTFVVPMGKNCQKYADDINKTNAVSLHIRRGDYANHAQTNATHGLTPLAYYAEAVANLNKRCPKLVAYVFSDEPDWCRQNLDLPVPTVYVSGNLGHEDMRLMSLCKHNVVANSSFSWWGAWLNPNPDKIVIAPKRWFATDELDSRDIVPENWERL